jgi:peptidoglycan/xylan/chitin deacetylase (PgdA/CDA1 family)
LTADQLRTISDSGMEIGAHTVSHRDLSAMGTVSAYHEIADSAMHLRITYHVPVVSLAYPSGHYRSTTPSIARLARMRFAVTTHHGIANEKSSPLLLPRIRMSGRQSGPVLVKWLNRFLIHRTS